MKFLCCLFYIICFIHTIHNATVILELLTKTILTLRCFTYTHTITSPSLAAMKSEQMTFDLSNEVNDA